MNDIKIISGVIAKDNNLVESKDVFKNELKNKQKSYNCFGETIIFKESIQQDIINVLRKNKLKCNNIQDISSYIIQGRDRDYLKINDLSELTWKECLNKVAYNIDHNIIDISKVLTMDIYEFNDYIENIISSTAIGFLKEKINTLQNNMKDIKSGCLLNEIRIVYI